MAGEESEDEVSSFMTVRVVEQLEVVDIDEGDTDRSGLGPDTLDGERQLADQGAVVQDAGQRIASRCLHDLCRLASDATLGGAEDQVQEDSREQGGRDRDDDYLRANVVERRDDGSGVSPDGDHALRRAIAVEEREVFSEQALRGERGADVFGFAGDKRRIDRSAARRLEGS